MECAHRGQVGADALGSLELAGDPQPDGEEAKVLAGDGEELDVCQEAELDEGLLFRVQGLARPGSPRVTLEKAGVKFEALTE